MPRTMEEIQREDIGKAKRAFDRTMSPDVRRLIGQGDRLEELNRINEECDRRLEAARAQFEAEYQDRLKREEIRVWEERSAPQPRAPAPNFAQDRAQLSDTAIRTEADRRVRLAHDRDIDAIERSREQRISGLLWEARQQQRADRSAKEANAHNHPHRQSKETIMQTENAPAHFKAEMHRLLDNANAERHAARRTFAQQRETLIEQARQGGAAEPDREVAKMFRQKLDDIDAKQHRDVDQLYVKYGWDRESKQFADHAQEPVQNAQQLEQAQNDRQAAREQDAQRAEELRSSLDQAIEHEAQAQDIDHGPEHDHDQGDQSQ